MAFLRHEVRCPAALAPMLDNWLRKLLQNPRRILAEHVKAGQKVLDVGCGPGVFTVAMAELVGEGGTVIAADVEDEMLLRVRKKAEKMGLSSRIRTHKCPADSIGLTEQVDFALAFYMVHEVPDRDAFFREIFSILKPGGRLLLVEPMFHVPKSEYEETVAKAKAAGLKPLGDRSILLSRAKLFGR